MKRVYKFKAMTLAELEAKFPDEGACKSYLQARRWPEGVKCPRCKNEKVYELAREYHWQCENCAADGYRFSVLVGTIFENTNVKLPQWFKVIYLMLSSKKGISALQVQRMLGFGSYHTAWSMCHRIRVAMGKEHFRKLIGTLINISPYKFDGPGGTGNSGGTGGYGKTIVVGAVQRKGKVVARVVANLSSETLCGFVREMVSSKVSLISTDERRGYDALNGQFPHGTVDHWNGEYVHGNVHTNTIEGFWSMVKRGVIGTFHKVSAKYLPLYVKEFEFRYNNRGNADIFGTAIKAC